MARDAVPDEHVAGGGCEESEQRGVELQDAQGLYLGGIHAKLGKQTCTRRPSDLVRSRRTCAAVCRKQAGCGWSGRRLNSCFGCGVTRYVRRLTACGGCRCRLSWTHHWRHPTLREDPSLWVASVRTRFQYGMMPDMHMCDACAQRLARSVDTALPAGEPVERTSCVHCGW